MSKYYEQHSIETKAVDEKNSTIDFVFSSENEDRHGDKVYQNFELERFLKNPVILNSHKSGDIENVIGKAEDVKIVDRKLQGKIKFAIDQNPKAKLAFDMVKAGFINATSIGFIPKQFDNEGNILLSELLEVSLVAVPANPDALALAHSKGITDNQLKEFYGINKSDQSDESDEEVPEEGTEGGCDNCKTDGEESDEDSEGNEEGGEAQGNEKEELTEGEAQGKTAEDNEDEDEGISGEKAVNNESQTLNIIARAVKGISELERVETRTRSVRAERKRLANKAIRNLIKLKNQ